MNKRWRRNKEKRPADIKSAAIRLFAIKGYGATKLGDIAKEAGISKGTIYRHYSSKEALFTAAIKDAAEELIPTLERLEEWIKEYRGDVDLLVPNLTSKLWATINQKRISCVVKLVIVESANFPGCAASFNEKIVDRMRNLFSSAIQRGIDANNFRPCDTYLAGNAFFAPLLFELSLKHSLPPLDEAGYGTDEYINTHSSILISGIVKVQSQ